MSRFRLPSIQKVDIPSTPAKPRQKKVIPKSWKQKTTWGKMDPIPKPKFKKEHIRYEDMFFNEKKRKLKTGPELKKASVGERAVAEWLLKNGIKFKIEKQFPDLINPSTGCNLRMDFYISSHKMCIEFDGRQHFKVVKRFDTKGTASLMNRQLRDEIKNQYCYKNNIKMVRIKYNEINIIGQILSPYFKQ